MSGNNFFYSIKRVNFLFKDRNPNFKKGHFQWRKNNSLVAGRINKIFDADDQLIDLSFEKLNELSPFPGSFDCELEPDYIDGGHGLQVCKLLMVICQTFFIFVFFLVIDYSFQVFQIKITILGPPSFHFDWKTSAHVQLSPSKSRAIPTLRSESVPRYFFWERFSGCEPCGSSRLRAA